MSTPYPFSALVGQDEMKLALLIAAVDQKVGGVLAFGDRGGDFRRRRRVAAAHGEGGPRLERDDQEHQAGKKDSRGGAQTLSNRYSLSHELITLRKCCISCSLTSL